MALLCIAGVVAVLRCKPIAMVIISLLSFFPVGWYLLGSPGIFKWIGWLNIVYLFSAIGMYYCCKRKLINNVQ